MTSPQQKILDTVLEDDEDEATDVVVEEDEDDEPSYLPAKGMSLPVPKSFGKYVHRLFDETTEAYRVDHQKWDRAFELYRQCGDEGLRLDEDTDYKWHLENEADENIIRNNVRTIMRSTYMQNPHIEFTDVTQDLLAESLEYLVSYMLNKQTYPGLNMKMKARKWILHGQLTNFGVIRLDYQPHEGSQQQAVNELHELEDKLRKAKSPQDVKDIYAHLERLHRQLPLSEAKGLSMTNVMSHRVRVPVGCNFIDLSDAQWLIEDFDMDRTYMLQTYYEKKRDGTYRMRSHPKATTEVVPEDQEGTKAVEANIVETVMNTMTQEQRDLKKKDTVLCVYFYDKLLRRVSLFNTEDWSHPLWVEEDDMGLSRFFRHFIIAFGEPIEGVIQPGEISYYVGQVNQINSINRKAAQIRNTIFNTLVYNRKGVDDKEVKKLVRHLRNPNMVRSFGIMDDAEGRKISEMLEALVPPAFEHKEVFDTQQLRAAVDRSASIGAIEKGEQFKTNTTNEQVQYYQNNRQETTGVLIDVIEEAFEALGWAISEILVSKYSKEEIVEIVGPIKAEGFESMSVPEFNQKYRMELAAGSIEKPSSEFKKKESLTIAQALGQVGQAAPGTTMKLMLRMFQAAFSNLLIRKEDWKMLDTEISANLTKGVSTSGPTQPPTAPTAAPVE